MKYSSLCEVYEKLDGTTKRLEKTYYISQLLKKTSSEDIETILLLLQGTLYHPWEDGELGVANRLVLKAINTSTGIELSRLEQEWKKTGDLGKVTENFVKKKRQATLFSKDISVKKVFDNLRRLPDFEGEGTVDKKTGLISELLTSATPLEARYIIRTVLGELRVGVGTGIVRDAIVWSELPLVIGIFTKCQNCHEWMPSAAKCLKCDTKLDQKFGDEIKYFKTHAATSKSVHENTFTAEKLDDVKHLAEKNTLNKFDFIFCEDEKLAREIYNYLVSLIQSAYDVTNDFSIVAKSLREKGTKSLGDLSLVPGKPVKVMLAQKVKDVAEGFEAVGKPAQFEYKYDGFRMLIGKSESTASGKAHGGSNISIFTRRLENVSKQFPEVVGFVKNHIKGDSFIIDCEAVGFDPKSGRYLPFQNVSQRIKRKYDIDKLAKELPVELNVFDVLFYDGKSMINEPFKARRELIEKIVKEEKKKIRIAEALVLSDEKAAEKFYHKSLDAGNEGVMIKALDSPYKPGSRVGFMVKLKPTMETLDLAVVAADWGEGKRATWLTSFTLACTDEDGNLLEIGKVGTGIKEKEDDSEDLSKDRPADAGKKGYGIGEVTFQMLTDLLKPLIISEKGKTAIVKPKVVLEVKFEEIQKSPTYGSGFALRFPRVVRLRSDRNVDEINTLEDVKKFYTEQ